MEDVKRELNEAIQKDMEMPSIISAQDDYFEQTPENLYGGARSSRSIEEETKELTKQVGVKKEIVLNAEQFKLAQQSKQPTASTAASKKKKKSKNKANA